MVGLLFLPVVFLRRTGRAAQIRAAWRGCSLGGAAGGVAAGLLFSKMPARILHLALGALIVFGGVRLLVC